MKLFLGLVLSAWLPLTVLAAELDQAVEASVLIFAAEEGDEEVEVVGHGSGVFVSSDGLILTNKHVLAGDVYAVYSYRWSEPKPADVLWVSSDADLALLRVEGSNGNPFVNFSESDPAAGEDVFAIGYPGTQIETALRMGQDLVGQKPSINKGAVVRIAGAPQVFVQHTAELRPGNSGGGLFNECGYLVGLNTFITSPDDRSTDFFSLSLELVEAELRGRIPSKVFGHRCVASSVSVAPARTQAATAVPPRSGLTDTQKGWAYVLALLAAVILSVRSYAAGKSRWLEQSSSQISADRPVVRGEDSKAAPSRNVGRATDPVYATVVGFDGSGRPVKLQLFPTSLGAYYLVGRNRVADLVIDDAAVSNAHFVMSVGSEGVAVTDLGSSNGTLIAGERLSPGEPGKWEKGQLLKVGAVELILT